MISIARARELPPAAVLMLLHDSLIGASVAALARDPATKTSYVERAHALLTLWSQKTSRGSGATARTLV